MKKENFQESHGAFFQTPIQFHLAPSQCWATLVVNTNSAKIKITLSAFNLLLCKTLLEQHVMEIFETEVQSLKGQETVQSTFHC